MFLLSVCRGWVSPPQNPNPKPCLAWLTAVRSLEDYNRLLHVVIVGGGPTGVEVAGELSNLINRDLKRIYPDRSKAMR